MVSPCGSDILARREVVLSCHAVRPAQTLQSSLPLIYKHKQEEAAIAVAILTCPSTASIAAHLNPTPLRLLTPAPAMALPKRIIKETERLMNEP